MGLEDLRKNLDSKNQGNASQINRSFETEQSNSKVSQVVGSLKNVLGARSNDQSNQNSFDYIRYDSNGNLKSVFDRDGDLYDGPWVEDILIYVADKIPFTAKTIANHFGILESDAQEYVDWFVELGFAKRNLIGGYRTVFNPKQMKTIMNGLDWFMYVDSELSLFRYDWPLDPTIGSLMIHTIRFSKQTQFSEQWLRENLHLGYRRTAQLCQDLQNLGIFTPVGSSIYKIAIAWDEWDAYFDLENTFLSSDNVPGIYDTWDSLFRVGYECSEKLLYKNEHSRRADLKRYYATLGKMDPDYFLDIQAHCVAEDDSYFDSLKEKLYKQPTYQPGDFEKLMRILKDIGFLKSYDSRGHVHAAMSYDDADLVLDELIQQFNAGALNTSVESGLVADVSSMNNMSGVDFEQYCKSVLLKNGYSNVQDTATTGDHGIDLVAEKDGIRYAIQCKRYSGNVGNKAVQEAYSGKGIYDADIAVVMTNSHFTPQAIEDAKRLRVKLWDGDYIASLEK